MNPPSEPTSAHLFEKQYSWKSLLTQTLPWATPNIVSTIEACLGEQICMMYQNLVYNELSSFQSTSQTFTIQEYFTGPPFCMAWNYERICNVLLCSSPRCMMDRAEFRPRFVSVPIDYLKFLYKIGLMHVEMTRLKQEAILNQPKSIQGLMFCVFRCFVPKKQG